MGADQKDVSRKNSEGGGVGGESEGSLLYIHRSLLFFSSLSDFAPYSIIWTPARGYHCENEKARKKKKAKMFLCSAILRFVYISAFHYTTPKMYVPRAPAMNPKIRAFSARLTRFAFLNISWAANIWSLWKRKEMRKRVSLPTHTNKAGLQWVWYNLLRWVPGLMSPKPESVNPNPKINQDHLQVAQTIFASYMTRALNYFGDFNASGMPQGYCDKIILFSFIC